MCSGPSGDDCVNTFGMPVDAAAAATRGVSSFAPDRSATINFSFDPSSSRMLGRPHEAGVQKKFMRTFSRAIVVLIIGLAVCLPPLAQSQLSQILQPKAAANPPTKTGNGPLGRETPSGTVFGFLEAAQSGNFGIAAQYLQMSPARRQAQGESLAMKLNVAMNRAFVGNLRPSRQPEGAPQEDVAPDRQKLGTMVSGHTEVDLELVRVSDPNVGRIWLFSAETLSKIPELYDQIQARRVETRLPAWVVKHELAGMPLWQWLALLVMIPMAAAAGWLLLVVLQIPLRWWARSHGQAALVQWRAVSGARWGPAPTPVPPRFGRGLCQPRA